MKSNMPSNNTIPGIGPSLASEESERTMVEPLERIFQRLPKHLPDPKSAGGADARHDGEAYDAMVVTLRFPQRPERVVGYRDLYRLMCAVARRRRGQRVLDVL